MKLIKASVPTLIWVCYGSKMQKLYGWRRHPALQPVNIGWQW